MVPTHHGTHSVVTGTRVGSTRVGLGFAGDGDKGGGDGWKELLVEQCPWRLRGGQGAGRANGRLFPSPAMTA